MEISFKSGHFEEWVPFIYQQNQSNSQTERPTLMVAVAVAKTLQQLFLPSLHLSRFTKHSVILYHQSYTYLLSPRNTPPSYRIPPKPPAAAPMAPNLDASLGYFSWTCLTRISTRLISANDFNSLPPTASSSPQHSSTHSQSRPRCDSARRRAQST